LTTVQRSSAATDSLPSPPARPYDVVVLGAGRVGGSYARALERAGHTITAELHRGDDPSPIALADVVVIAVPDDVLGEAAGLVLRLARAGSVVVHTCGLAGIEPLADVGPLVAAVHPAAPIASNDQSLDGVVFGVTCPPALQDWVSAFVADLGGTCVFIGEHDRPLYHAALVMASNFPVALAGDAAEAVGDHGVLVPLMRAMVDNIAALGPDAALTGPIARGDVGTVRAHLAALPDHLRDVYVACARRTLARARSARHITAGQAAAIEEALGP